MVPVYVLLYPSREKLKVAETLGSVEVLFRMKALCTTLVGPCRVLVNTVGHHPDQGSEFVNTFKCSFLRTQWHRAQQIYSLSPSV